MATKRFPAALKRARKQAGLSQKALAAQVQLTGSYISQLESGARRPPRTAVVKRLCKAMDVAEQHLLDLAALERSPPGIRKRIERMNKERGQVHRSRDRLLSTTLFHMARGPRVIDPMSTFVDLPSDLRVLVGRLVGRHRAVKSIEEAEERSEDLLAEASDQDRDLLARVLPGVLAGAPPSAETPSEVRRLSVYRSADRKGEPVDAIEVDARLGSEAAFLLRVEDDEAHPRVEAGDLLLLDPGEEPRGGDVVVVSKDGRDLIRVWHRQGGGVRLDGMRPEQVPMRITAESFEGLTVLLLIRALR